MQLTTTPDRVAWPETHYVFLEKIGPFPTNAPLAWQELHQRIPELAQQNTITGYFSLYKVTPEIYRASVSVAAKPGHLPPGLRYEKFHGGDYLRFVLTGSYANLGEACGRTFQIVSDERLPLRDDFNIENYVNDPRSTPEEQLVTEILFPAAPTAQTPRMN